MMENPEWLSTYGFLTAERILERFKIKLSKSELLKTLHDPNGRYHHLLTMPLKNIFNGILINQVYDYQVYAQKLFVDYFLYRKNIGKTTDQRGTHAEEELAIKKDELIQLGTQIDEKIYQHRQLISDSQAWLIHEAPTHKQLALAEELAIFGERAEALMSTFTQLRTVLRTLILDIKTLLSLIPDYQIDEEKIAENQANLNFNITLGDDKQV